MPHLSPLNWFVIPIIMGLILTCFITIIWWHVNPSFSCNFKSSSNLASPSWHWW